MAKRRVKRWVKVVAAFLLALLVVWGLLRLGKAEQQPAPVEFPPQTAISMSDAPTETASTTGLERAVWVSYLEAEQILTGQEEEAFRANFRALCEQAANMGFTALILQLRAHGDAFYPSEVYPWAAGVTGVLEQVPDYDPLAIALEEASRAGLLVHGWINPYRLLTSAQQALLQKDYYPENACFLWEDCWYLNPAKEESRALILAGAEELLARYALDGLQLDDYFCPTAPEQFGETEASVRTGITALVRELSARCRQAEVSFAISPAGYFSDHPTSDDRQLTSLTAWADEGLLDAVLPQVYWDFNDEQAPFAAMVERWTTWGEEHGVPVVIGLAAYKFGSEALLAQEQAAMEDGADGVAVFRFDYVAEG